MIRRTRYVTAGIPRYVHSPRAEVPLARLIAFVLLVIPVLGIQVARVLATAAPSEPAQQLAHFNARQAFTESQPHFLPTPVAALPPEAHAGPLVPAEVEAANQSPNAALEQVKVANTGGVGVLLRADPPSGRFVAGLMDGQVLTVLEHKTVGDAEWLRVITQDGMEGWVFAKLVGPAR